MKLIAALLYDLPAAVAGRLGWLPPLLARITVGWVFAVTGWGKLQNLQAITDYFTELGIPYPELQAPFASATELVCGVLILVGLGTRIASIPLIVVMLVAIATAQWQNVDSMASLLGLVEWAYIAIFVWLAIAGPGPLSLDHVIERRRRGDAPRELGRRESADPAFRASA
ncbi:MAG: DoxX family protein [Candidatus Binatia bacterium]